MSVYASRDDELCCPLCGDTNTHVDRVGMAARTTGEDGEITEIGFNACGVVTDDTGWFPRPAHRLRQHPVNAADTPCLPAAPPSQEEYLMSYLIDESQLTGITLAKGAHDRREQGMCLLEVVAWVAGEPHSDRPTCVSPVLAEMGRGLNDVLPDALRQQLVPLIPALPGTAGDGHDETRSYMALDWLIRTWLPTWLDLSPACRDHAAKVRELGRIVDLASAKRAAPVVREAGESARAAWDAAWAAAGDAAGDAVWDAAWASAWDAAADAAWAAAEAAAEAAAGDAAWVAAWDAARDHLQPTVVQLQRSAIELYRAMIRPEAA